MCNKAVFYSGVTETAQEATEISRTASAGADDPLLGGYVVEGGENGIFSTVSGVAKPFGSNPTTKKKGVSS